MKKNEKKRKKNENENGVWAKILIREKNIITSISLFTFTTFISLFRVGRETRGEEEAATLLGDQEKGGASAKAFPY